jgi:hypothetical protein
MGAAKKVGGLTAAVAAVGAAFVGTPIEQHAKLQLALTGTCPATVACVEWLRPTANTDGTPISSLVPITYTVYRGNTSTNLFGNPVATTTALNIMLPNNTGRTQTLYYAVTATAANGTSAFSNLSSKLLRAPGPTDGRIEGPTDGGIED